MSQNIRRKSALRKERNNCKIYTGWIQEWTSSKRIRRNKCLDINEVVRGPFSSPRLIKTRPFVTFSCCEQQVQNVNKTDSDIRRGIPDTWREYLASKGLCGITEANMLQKHLIPSCVRCFTTNKLWNERGLPFTQGIPDPWKNRFLHRNHPIKCPQQRYSCVKSNSSTQIGCIYDGDDEAEIEHSVRCHFNKDYVNCKKDLSQEAHNESNCPLIDREICRTFDSNSEGVKRNRKKYINQVSISNNSLELIPNQKKCRKEIKDDLDNKIKFKNTVYKSEEITVCKNTRKHKREQLNKKQSLAKKCQNNLNNKTILKKKVQTVPVEIANETVQTYTTPKEKCEQTQNLFSTNQCELNTQMWPNTLCCNCILQNYMISNAKCFSGCENSMKDVDLSNRVLCHDCNKIYCKSNPEKLTTKTQPLRVCTPRPKRCLKQQQMLEWTKLKVCTCMQKAKKRFKELNRVGHSVEIESMIAPEKELKLMCYHCSSSYLKIETTHTNDSKRNINPWSCKKMNKSRDERNRTTDCVTKHSITRKGGNIARDSKKCYCTCAGNKSHISQQNLERTLHPKVVKCRNDVTINNNHCLLKDHSCNGNMLKNETQKVKVNKKILKEDFDDKLESEELIGIMKIGTNSVEYNQSFLDNRRKRKERKRKVLKNSCYDEQRWNRKHKNKNENLKADEILWYVSDSGHESDASGNISDIAFNVNTDQNNSSVTSLTFMRYLNDSAPVKKLLYQQISRKCQPSKSLIDTQSDS